MTPATPSPELARPRSRRRWLLATVGAAAALGGAGLAWFRYQPDTMSAQAEARLWQLELATPEGRPLRLAAFRGRPLMLNFWATWCPPCVEELPLLSRFYLENAAKGWQVLALAVDQPDAVKRFLAQAPVSFPVVLAGTAGIELYQSLGNLSGGLPFTVVLGSDGRVAHRKMGKITADDLQAWSRLK